jgi:Tol biopolymer transport system component
VVLAALGPAPSAAQVDPSGDWRTLETEHFAITYPAGRERVAQRAAVRAEMAWDALVAFLPEPDVGLVELLLTGDVDFSNGFARVAPAPRITVYLRPPVDGFALSGMDDWLDLVITHELAHVFHLEATGPQGGFLRRIFGRVPLTWLVFPGFGTPEWTVEGLATWVESEVTGSGRLANPWFDMMLRTAALEGFLSTVDRASGSSPQWPAGEQSYLYGGFFFDWLLDEYGEDRLRIFVEEVAGQWIPYRLNAASREAFGISFSDAWEAWTREVEAEARGRVQRLAALGPVTEPQVLTSEARVVAYAAAGADGSVVYARSDGRTDPQLRFVAPGGGERFGRRVHGLVRPAWSDDGTVLFAQPQFVDRWTIRSDLWRMGVDGSARRITRGARLDHPSPYPGGERVAAIRYAEDAAVLVTVSLPDGEVRELEELPAGGTWGFPAVSPDGRWIAASWWDGSGADLVLLDGESGRVVHRITDDGAHDLSPSWSGDGTLLVWGSDRSGIPQIEAVSIDPRTGEPAGRRAVTRVVSGAAFPAVDTRGGWVWFSHYTSLGWELARVPLDPTGWPPAAPAAPHAGREPRAVAASLPLTPVDTAGLQVGGYNALSSLRPRFWSPLFLPGERAPGGDIVRSFVGVSTGTTDLLERHIVQLRAALSLSGDQFQGSVGYAFAGLGNPVIDVVASQTWDGAGPFFGQRSDAEPPEALYIRERERRVSVGGDLVRRRWTNAVSLGLRAGMVWEDRSVLGSDFRTSDFFTLARPSSRLGEVQATLSVSNVRGHALSTGSEEGASLTLLARARRQLGLPDSLRSRAGLDRSDTEVVGLARLFQSFPGPGYGDHVVGVRVAGGAARGPGADALTWEVGGTSGSADPLTGIGLLGGESYLFPVRGFDNGVRSGRYAWSAAAEYRFPLGLVNRGLGLFPLHLDRLHGAVFGDAGNAWGPELGIGGFDRPRGDPVWSTGVEVSARLNLLYNLPLELRSGVVLARGQGSRRLGGTAWYVRFGPAF